MKNNKEFTFEILDVIEILEESEKSDWGKALLKVSYNNNTPTLDIRNINLATLESDRPIIGKGITLSDEGLIRLSKALMEQGYLEESDAEEYFNNRDSIFKPKSKKKRRIIKVKKIK